MPRKVELANRIEKYVKEHGLDNDKVRVVDLTEIANACNCKVVDVMSWFKYGRVI